jgi:hypothetical protein
MRSILDRFFVLVFVATFASGCGGSSSGPVEIAPMTQTPTSELPEGDEPELSEEGP